MNTIKNAVIEDIDGNKAITFEIEGHEKTYLEWIDYSEFKGHYVVERVDSHLKQNEDFDFSEIFDDLDEELEKLA